MNRANLQRAINLYDEIVNVSEQIKNARKIMESQKGFIIAEHSDGSGEMVDYVYYDGNYPIQLYQNIIKNVIAELEKHLDELNKEVEKL